MQQEVAQTVSSAAEPVVRYEKPVTVVETPPTPQPQRTITQADIDTTWAACKQRFATDMQLRVIANDITLTLLNSNELQCVLQAQSQQTTFEQKIQPELIRFFREKLSVTFSLHISVPEVVVEQKLYAPHEKFDYLVQKNPAVETLKQKLQLEL